MCFPTVILYCIIQVTSPIVQGMPRKREPIFTKATETDNCWRQVTRLNWQIISPATANPAFLSTLDKLLNPPLETIPRLKHSNQSNIKLTLNKENSWLYKDVLYSKFSLSQILASSFKPDWSAEVFLLRKEPKGNEHYKIKITQIKKPQRNRNCQPVIFNKTQTTKVLL